MIQGKMTRPLLDVQGLTVRFTSEGKEHCAVDNISFSLNASETLALVGESGSGKTVTALALLRLVPSPPGRISAGRILFTGRDGTSADLMSPGEEIMQQVRGTRISMIFQEPMTSLNPVYCCGDQVAESLKVHLGYTKKRAREQVVRLFGEVMLPEPERIYKAYPHQLSGGQKQRVMIAMAIACDPLLLIADEPTTALDVTVQKTILELLKRLQGSRRMSILFITHDLGIVRGFADRVAVMSNGKIVEQGTTADIFNNPVHPYTRGLLACRPSLTIRPASLPTVEQYLAGGAGRPAPVITPDQRKKEHERLYAANPVLVVEKLAKKFGSFTALEPASFGVYPGETLGIVGESGSGKTTLARVILELIPPTEGRVLYNGFDITRLTGAMLKKMRKELQIIFQDPYSSLNPRLTAGRSIAEPMKVHGLHENEAKRKERVTELLRMVGLKPEYYGRYPHEFSGGQRQRICIARALAVEPRLIICDESVSALDVSIQAQVLNLLNELKRNLGLTYIFISHDLSVVRYMSDRLIVMNRGRIEEMGEADAIYANPRSEYTRRLMEAIPGEQVTKWTGGQVDRVNK